MKSSNIASIDQAFNPRENSLTLIRLSLATIVVYSHSFEIGGYGLDPLKEHFGVSFGELAVDSFFAISGFLITSSFLKSKSVINYLWKRVLRIFPGYWACLVVIALLICPIIYSIQNQGIDPTLNLFDNPFLDYVKSNFWLRINQSGIKNLFFDHPAQGVINGSLWSLFPEFLCYLLVIFLGRIHFLKERKIYLIFLFIGLFITYSSHDVILEHFRYTSFYGKIWYLLKLIELSTYFISGMLLYLYRCNILFSLNLLIASILCLCLSICFKSYFFASPIVLIYILIGISIQVPSFGIDKIGDYSYGIYIYSYSIQQTIYFFNQSLPNSLTFFLITLGFTLPFAWFSWVCIEKPCLKLKELKIAFFHN